MPLRSAPTGTESVSESLARDAFAPTGTAPHRHSRRGVGRRRALLRLARGTALPLAILPYVTSGCYTYADLRQDPAAGTRIVLDVSDEGRVALGPRLGRALATIEGDLLQRTDSTYVIRMQQVRTLDGVTTHWDGETVSLHDEYIVDVGHREFSRSRTAFAAIGFLVAVGAIIAGQSLTGSGSGDDRPGPGGGQGPDR